MKTIITFLFFTCAIFAQVGINTTSPQAVLDIQSSESGILIPRLTTDEINAIPSPANSMLVYNVSLNKYQYYVHPSWITLTTTNTALNYRVYIAKITQQSTLPPQVDVIVNTLGFDITWARNYTGRYYGTAPANSFPVNKRFALIGTSTPGTDTFSAQSNIAISFNGMGTNRVKIVTGSNGVPADQVLYQTEVEIRVYD